MSKISIIMGIYNCQDTLTTAIKSIITQTFSDWELIMCDDGSTDDTYDIAKEFASKYNNIILIKNTKNSGLAYSLNKCLEIATGEYIARMDADDISLPQRFELQVEFLDKNKKFDVVGSSVILYDDRGEHAVRKMIVCPEKKDLVKSVPHIHPTIMIRKNTLSQLNGYTVSSRTKRCEDADLWYRFYSHGFKGYNIEIPLLKYHESILDYKKRNTKVALNGMKNRFIGYRKLKLPFIYYIYIFKPLISLIIPNRLMYFYHKKLKGILKWKSF